MRHLKIAFGLVVVAGSDGGSGGACDGGAEMGDV